MIRKTNQVWEVGSSVNVGFMKGLKVIAKVPTPGDYAPDAYVLEQGEKFYSFVPHNGLSRLTANEAQEMMGELK